MIIFVALDYSGNILDVVAAKSYELATVYWQGKNIIPHHTRQITQADFGKCFTGVLPIVTTKEVQGYTVSREDTFRAVVKP